MVEYQYARIIQLFLHIKWWPLYILIPSQQLQHVRMRKKDAQNGPMQDSANQHLLTSNSWVLHARRAVVYVQNGKAVIAACANVLKLRNSLVQLKAIMRMLLSSPWSKGDNYRSDINRKFSLAKVFHFPSAYLQVFACFFLQIQRH